MLRIFIKHEIDDTITWTKVLELYTEVARSFRRYILLTMVLFLVNTTLNFLAFSNHLSVFLLQIVLCITCYFGLSYPYTAMANAESSMNASLKRFIDKKTRLAENMSESDNIFDAETHLFTHVISDTFSLWKITSMTDIGIDLNFVGNTIKTSTISLIASSIFIGLSPSLVIAIDIYRKVKGM